MTRTDVLLLSTRESISMCIKKIKSGSYFTSGKTLKIDITIANRK